MTDCVLCDESLDHADPGEVHIYSPAGSDTTNYEVHKRCWDDEGLYDASHYAIEPTLAYHDAIRQDTFAAAADVLTDSLHGRNPTPAWDLAIAKTARDFEELSEDG